MNNGFEPKRGTIVVVLEFFFKALKLISKHMFRAIGAFFQLVFLLILFKIFAPGIYELLINLITTILTIVNDGLANYGSSTPSF